MKRIFTYTDNKSNKFWSIEVEGCQFTVVYGKVGTTGQTQIKEFASEAECQKAAAKLVAEKAKKGYVEQGEGSETPSGSEQKEKPTQKAAEQPTSEKSNTERRESITLCFRQGNSDKVYHAELLPADDGSGYLVNAAWGRRGSTMQTASKTAKPLPYEKARAIYDKLVTEKQAKGYTQGNDGAVFVGTDKADRVSGLLPQLLNVIEEAAVEELISNPHYCAQPKHDGERRMVKDTTTGVNRKGLTVAMPEHMVETLAASVNGMADLDGEMEGDYYTVFDILTHNGVDLRQRPYSERLAMLTQHVKPTHASLAIIETAFTADEKRALFNRLRDTNKEGVVFKRLDAPYTHGRPSSGGTQLKYKFCASATVVVVAQNEGKRSVVMGLYNAKGERYEVGSVTIPVNYDIPEVGQVVEVRYLYAYPQGSLFQPVYGGVRTDMEEADCVESQLKYKATGRDE